MIFAWDDLNRTHLAKHNVTPDEAREIVSGAQSPFPTEVGDGKLVVWGQTTAGRYLQVIFVRKSTEDIEYERFSAQEWLEIASENITHVARIIHAMELTPAMKTRLRQRRR